LALADGQFARWRECHRGTQYEGEYLMIIRKAVYAGLVGVAMAGMAGGTAAVASASTGPGTITAVTHSAQHDDTTNVYTGVSSDNGPVWAYDNLSERITVVPETAPGNYSVTINVTGSFQGFADPTTGLPLTSSGPVQGTIQYDVQSSTAPDKASLLPNQAPNTGLGAAISQLFDGHSTIVGGGDYTFSYQNGNYVQNTTTITGDVR
jgi:hypothetical protein